MSFVTNDIAEMLADFGESIMISGTTLTGIFQNEYEAASLYGLDIDSASPVLVCRSVDATDLAINAMVERSGAYYYIKSIQPDGTGATVLVLSEDE